MVLGFETERRYVDDDESGTKAAMTVLLPNHNMPVCVEPGVHRRIPRIKMTGV